MSLPLKAIRYGQWKKKTEGTVIPPSGHQVIKVEFVDTDGKKVLAFFKGVAPDYPPILCKYAVASSLMMRGWIGEAVAEERLVLNDKDEIVGTVSIALPEYKRLHGYGETALDNQEKELVNPSRETLMQRGCVELLAALYLIKEEDTHIYNIGTTRIVDNAVFGSEKEDGTTRIVHKVVFGSIDRDMSEYSRTHIMKGCRLVEGLLKPIPKKVMSLKPGDLDNFPNVEGRTHWPANNRPGNFNYFKHHLAAEAFQSLAANPSLETEKGPVSFQEQLFSALLKILLNSEPELRRARFEDYFGDLPLDYLSLELSKREALEREAPTKFNVETNDKPFVDHILDFFQDEYNESYRTVVLYTGCKENDYGVSVVGFANFLRNKPSAFKNILEWAARENKRMDESWKAHLAKKTPSTTRENKPVGSEKGAIPTFVDSYCVAPEGRYNLEKMKQRYHKIWRDAHEPIVGAILEKARVLANDMANSMRVKPLPLKKIEVPSIGDPKLTEAWQLLGEPEPVEESKKLDCHPESSLRVGLRALEIFIEQVHQRASDYYKLPLEELTPENNQLFIEFVDKLIRACEKGLGDALGNDKMNKWRSQFNPIAEDLQRLTCGLQFQRHLLSLRDLPLEVKAEYDYIALLKRKHTDEEVVTMCLNALFDWANKLEKGVLDDYINTVIEGAYKPSPYNVTANRPRAQRVKEYLKSSEGEDGANRLATILSTGGCTTTSLNTKLIKCLIPIMLQDTNQVDVNLLSVRSACGREELDVALYTLRAKEFALNDKRFVHIHAKIRMEQLNEIMYQWVRDFPRPQFKKMVYLALSKYEPYGFNVFSHKKRGPIVRGYFEPERELSNEKILAFIFAEGGIDSTSLNPKLFKLILAKIKEDITTDKKKATDPAYNIVLQAEIGDFNTCPLLSSLETYAKPRSFNSSKESTHKGEKSSSLIGLPAKLGKFASPKHELPSSGELNKNMVI